MKILCISFLPFFAHLVVDAQVTYAKLSLPYGAYKVGFRHFTKVDNTRAYERMYEWNNSIIGRPIPVSLWFPSKQGTKNSQLTIQNYMTVLKEEEEWEQLPDERILDWFYYSNSAQNKTHLKERVKAIGNTTPIQRKFPVVIYAPSYQASSAENFALCEFLASHGYVVISSPSRGTDTRFMDGATTRDIETQARDIQFLISEICSKPYADANRIAVIGFSFGGISNVLAQMMDRRIKAVVCLDGSIKYQFEKIISSPYFNISKFNVPFIFMSQKDIPLNVLVQDKIDTAINSRFQFYDSLKYSKAYALKWNDLTHPYFSSMGVLFQERDIRQDKSDISIMNSYRWVNIYTLNFLNAFLNKDTQALRFLENTPEANGVAGNTVEKQSKEPQGRQFSFEDFNLLAVKQGYLKLDELYLSIKKDHPAFKPEEWKLNNLGLALLFKNKLQEGIRVLMLSTTLFPGSANTYDSLAEGYLIAGDKKRAAENFRKSLELNAENQNAIDRLKQLGQ